MKFFTRELLADENKLLTDFLEQTEQTHAPEMLNRLARYLPADQPEEFYHGAAYAVTQIAALVIEKGVACDMAFVNAALTALCYSALRRQEDNNKLDLIMEFGDFSKIN